MPTAPLLIYYVESTLLAVVAAGLCMRRRVPLCWSFFVYVLAVSTIHRLFRHWPERFYVFSWYVSTETTLVVLKMLIALEIWQRCFSSFPRARVRVGLLLVGALLATAAAGRVIPPDLDFYDAFVGVLNPRGQAGSLALYAIIVSAASWYRIPIHPLHRAILLGFAVYLSVHTLVLTSYVGWSGGTERAGQWGLVPEAAAYIVTTSWWAWAAWRPSRAPSPILSRLQPWAHSW